MTLTYEQKRDKIESAARALVYLFTHKLQLGRWDPDRLAKP
jgi:hypothetical protein